MAASIIDLINNPKLVSSEIERERAARRGAPGWLGITPRYDPQAVLAFGDGACVAEVHPRSPAWRAGLRTGDVIEPISVPGIGQVPLENFDTLRLPARTEIGVKFFRPNATGRRSSAMAVVVKLAPWPRTRQWETGPRVAPGRRVTKKDRPKFLADTLDYLRDVIPSPQTRHLAYSYLSMLLLKRDNDRNRGVWETYSQSASFLGVTARTVNDLSLMLRWFGVLKLLEWPTPERNSNLVEIAWPERNKIVRSPAVPPPPAGKVRRIRL